MTAGLAVGITLAVAGACGVGAYLYAQRHYETMLDSERLNVRAPLRTGTTKVTPCSAAVTHPS